MTRKLAIAFADAGFPIFPCRGYRSRAVASSSLTLIDMAALTVWR